MRSECSVPLSRVIGGELNRKIKRRGDYIGFALPGVTVRL